MRQPWPSAVALCPGETTLWLLDLDQPADPDWRQLLDGEERARHDRLQFESDRQQFLAAHALLRLVLALYTGCDAREIRFRRGDRGKPWLVGGPAFNLSHSGRYCLLGVTDAGEIGVDIERHRDGRRLEALARRCFDGSEAESLLALPAELRQQRFYTLWTLKEAMIKACGQGMAMPLQSFGFSLAECDSQLALRIDSTRPEARMAWNLFSYHNPPGYSMALCLGDGTTPPANPRCCHCLPGHWVEFPNWPPASRGRRAAEVC